MLFTRELYHVKWKDGLIIAFGIKNIIGLPGLWDGLAINLTTSGINEKPNGWTYL